MKTKLKLLAAGGVVTFVFSSAGFAQNPDRDDDRQCLDYGAVRGTGAYFECRARLERERTRDRSEFFDRRVAPSEGEQNLSDGLALSECERRARQTPPHPIKRRATTFVFPGREKRVSISFEIVKPGASSAFWSVDCKFSRGVMTDFNAR